MQRRTLYLAIGLAVSLAFNMLFIGIMLGHRAAGGKADGRGEGGRPDGRAEGRAPPGFASAGPGGLFIFDRAMSAIPEELRDDLRRKLNSQKDDIRLQSEAVRTARREVVRALSARPFDPAAAAAAFATLRRQIDGAQERLHTATIDVMSGAQATGTLPPPGRSPMRPPPPPRDGPRGEGPRGEGPRGEGPQGEGPRGEGPRGPGPDGPPP